MIYRYRQTIYILFTQNFYKSRYENFTLTNYSGIKCYVGA